MSATTRPTARRGAAATLVLLILATVLPLLSPAAQAAQDCTTVWDGEAGTTDWHHAANWTTNVLPGPSDVVCIYGSTAGNDGVTVSAAMPTQVAAVQSDTWLRTSTGAQLEILGDSYLLGLEMNGGVVTIGTLLDVQDMTQNDGLVDGNGTLRVTGFLRWEAGEQWGPGRTEIYPDGDFGGLSMTQDTARRALGRPIDALAGMEMDAGSLELAGQDSVLTLGAPSGVVSGSGWIKGTGRVQVDSELIVAEGGSLDIEARMDSGDEASVRVLGESVLSLYGGGTHGASFFMEDAASLQLRGGTTTFKENAPITAHGDGEVQIASDDTDATVLGTYGVGETTIMAGTLRLNEGADTGPVAIIGGTLDVSGAVTAEEVGHDEGTLTGTGTLTVTGDYEWVRGTQAGEGFTDIKGSLFLTGPNVTRTIDTRVVDAEVLDWVESGSLVFSGSEPFLTAGSTWMEGVDATVDGAVGSFQPGDLSLTADAHLVVKSAFETGADDKVTLDGENTFLDLQGGGEHHGTLQSADTVGVNLGGTHTFHADSQILMSTAPIGIYEGGNVTFGGSQTVVEDINSSGQVTVDTLVNMGSFINHGIVTVNDGKLLWLDDYRQMSEDGWTDLAGPTAEISIEGPGQVELVGGLLEGSGKITGNLVNTGGYVSPTGEMDVTGNYTQGAAATLGVATDGDAVDRLTVSGAATLDGTLEVVLGETGATQPLEVVKAAIVSGEFATVTGSDECWDIVHDATGVYLWPQPCVAIAPASGTEDFGVVAFPVTLSTVHDVDVTVTYATQNGTATAGSDFAAANGSVTIPAGETQGTIEVATVADDEAEDDETFAIAVSAAGARLGTTSVTGTILDDDPEDEEPTLEFSREQIPTLGVYSTPTEMSDGYAVGHSTMDYHGANDFAYYYNLETGSFAYWGDVIYAWDINEQRQLVGDCGENLWTTPCFRSNLINHDVTTGDPAGLNDHGQLVGSKSVPSGDTYSYQAMLWDSYDQSPRVLADDALAIDINNNGVVAGVTYASGAPTQSSWVWSESTGRIEIPGLAGFTHMKAEAINGRGTVVGYAAAVGAPAPHAWSWHPTTGTVDLGPGVARDVNQFDDIVGAGQDPDTQLWGAALWRDGEVHDLNDHLSQPASFRLSEADAINDNGLITASALGGEWVGVLRPPEEQTPADVTMEVKAEEQQYPTGQWTGAGGRVIDGNTVRITATLTNEGDEEQTVDLELLDPEEESLLDDDEGTVTLAPGESKDVEVEWDTTGRAWNGASPRADIQWISAVLWQGIDATRTQIGLEVNPRPVVLVHGLWSDESTWDGYPQMLAAKHPGWRGYAIPNMDTQSFVPNLISENANLLDTYIRQVQEGENAWQVDIVGHSMGGLISRYYIQEFMTTLQGKNAVANLVMLGTPNGGSPCAELAAVPATYELRPDVQAEFNANITDRKGVPFSLAAGIHTPLTCHAPLPGDDVVPVESAQLGMEDTLLFEIGHTSMTGSQMLFDQWVVPHLTTDAAGINGAGLLPDVGASSGSGDGTAAAEPTEPGQMLFARTLYLGPGESTSEFVDLEAGMAALGAMAVAPGSVEVTLSHTTETDEHATSGTVDDPNPGFRTVNLADPAAGEWLITAVNHGEADVEVPLSAWVVGSDDRLEAEASQVGTTDGVQVTATLEAGPFSEGPWVDAEVMDMAGRVEQTDLWDDGQHGDGAEGDGVFGGEVDGFTSGGHLVVVRAGAPGFSRAAITTVDLQVEGDTPDNDAPTATAQDHTANRNTTSWITLEGDDPDADELTFEIVTQPQHGTLTVQGPAGSPLVKYVPHGAYMGPDSFTFRAFDGELWSEPATVSIDVIGMETTFTYFSPWPAQGVEGTDLLVTANLVDSRGEGPQWAPVEFTFNGETIPSQTGIGLASANLDLRGVAPGQYELGFSFAGNETHLPSSGSQIITVLASTPPNPNFTEGIVGEAGYDVRIGLRANDPDGNAELYEFDFTDDGIYDAQVTNVSKYNEYVSVEYAYPEAFEGTVRARVTDNTGLVAEATTTVDIAPHRPLGNLRMIEVDGIRIENIDLSADGDTILYEVTDNEDQYQLATPYGVLDRESGEHELVSYLPDGSLVDWPGAGAISAGGDFVVFSGPESQGSFRSQTYLRDVEAGVTTMVSRTTAGQPASNGAFPVDVSADGRYVLFVSSATNLTDQDIMDCGTNGSQPCEQLYLRDLQAGTTTLISTNPDGTARGGHYWADLTDDGRYVAFMSRNALLLWDREVGGTEVLEVTIDGQTPDSETSQPRLSEDGRYVIFNSGGDNVIEGDTNGAIDVFRHDRQTGVTELVSATPEGDPADGFSGFAMGNCDGSLIAFWSYADDLVEGDTDFTDVFLRDMTTGTTRRISVEDRDQLQGNWDSQIFPHISADGRWITFESEASNLVPGDTNGADRDTFLLDTGITRGCGGETNDPPVVAIDDAGPLVEGGEVDLTATFSDPDGDELTATWSTDAGTITPTGADTATLAADDGPEDVHVTLTVSDGTVAASDTVTVAVTNAPPAAAAGDDLEVEVGQQVSFAGSATDPSAADTTAGLDLAWDFGDGETGEDGDLDHVYDEPGTYTATLTATDKDGGTDTDTRTITVVDSTEPNQPPTAAIGDPADLVEGGELTLDATVDDPDDDELSVTWTSDAGTITGDATGATLAVDDGPTEVEVTLTVSDGIDSTSDSVMVEVTNAPPVAAAGDDSAASTGATVTFAGSATDPSVADTTAGLDLAWDFGDGETGDGAATDHVYDEPGTYTATLTATDKDGGTDTDTRTVTVTEAPSGVPGPPVDVSAIGGDSNAAVQWDPPLDDGGSPVTGYELVVSPGGTAHELGNVESFIVPGLTNGTEYTFSVRARNANGYGPFSAASNVAIPRAVCAEDAFSDVADDHPFCPEIDWMADHDIAQGWPDGTYRPLRHVSRAAMAAFAYRLAGFERGPDPTCEERPFPDVEIDNPFCGEITWARDNGISSGYADGTFRSEQPISRQAMAAFLYRLTDAPRGEDPACTQDEFSDVPASHPLCGEIDWVVDSGVAGGYDDGTFKPTAPISRQAMAAFIFRYDILTGIVTG